MLDAGILEAKQIVTEEEILAILSEEKEPITREFTSTGVDITFMRFFSVKKTQPI